MGRELGTCHNIDPEEPETNVGVEEDLRGRSCTEIECSKEESPHILSCALRLSSKNSCEGVESLLDDEDGLIREAGAIGGKDKDLVAL